MVAKYEREAMRSWDLFYKRNGTNFFKDRHYLDTVFEDLRENSGSSSSSCRRKRFLEVRMPSFCCWQPHSRPRPVLMRLPVVRSAQVGCGVGNAFLPVLETNAQLDGVAVDFSPNAIALLRAKEAYCRLRAVRGPGACVAHVCDVTQDPLPAECGGPGGVDLVLLLYCLSAIAPAKMARAVGLLAHCLAPGGTLMFRDYGRSVCDVLREGES